MLNWCAFFRIDVAYTCNEHIVIYFLTVATDKVYYNNSNLTLPAYKPLTLWQPPVLMSTSPDLTDRAAWRARVITRCVARSACAENKMQRSEAAAGGPQRGQRMIFTGANKMMRRIR